MPAPNLDRLIGKSVKLQILVSENGGAFVPILGDMITLKDFRYSEDGEIRRTKYVGVERDVPDHIVSGYTISGTADLVQGDLPILQARMGRKEFQRRPPLQYKFTIVANFTSTSNLRWSLGGETELRITEFSASGDDNVTMGFEGFGQTLNLLS